MLELDTAVGILRLLLPSVKIEVGLEGALDGGLGRLLRVRSIGIG